MQTTSDSHSVIHKSQITAHKSLRSRRTHMLARYYTSGSGRFLQVDPGYDYDPMDPMSYNLYGYVRGNPIMGVDPTGKFELPWEALDYANYMSSARRWDASFHKAVADPTAENITQAAVDFTYALVDGACLIAPVIPAVAGRLRQGAELGVKTVEQAAEHVDDAARATANEAHSAKSALNLKKSLASEKQMAETGKQIAKGEKIADVDRLTSDYGGKATDWVKKSSSQHVAEDGTKIETHWYENTSTGKKVELKTKISTLQK